MPVSAGTPSAAAGEPASDDLGRPALQDRRRRIFEIAPPSRANPWAAGPDRQWQVRSPPPPSDPRGTATATCATGKVALGGGQATNDETDASKRSVSVVQESYPSSTTTWTVVGGLVDGLNTGKRMTVTACVLCSL